MSAPLDPSSALLPFGESTMLPGLAYTSSLVHAWEQRHLFADSWTCLGRVSSLAASGNQHALTLGGIGFLVTISPTGPQAFANVCRHRAHELLSLGTSCARPNLVCPYHGWSYSLDGALKTAPRMDSLPSLSLVELPCVDWHGWLFVNASGTSGDFASHVGTLDSLVAPYDPSSLLIKASHTYEVAANWKILAENYHECYHCPLIHPELCAISPPTSGNNWHDEPGNWIGGSMDLRDHAVTMSLDGSSSGIMLLGAPSRTVRYLGLFPNLLLSLHPDYVMTHLLTPLSPALTRVTCQWLFDPGVSDPSYAVDFWDLVNKQDWTACESVQRGVSSPHFRPGPLAPNENAVYDWVRMIALAYRDL